MVSKPGVVPIYERGFSMQTLKSSPTSCFMLTFTIKAMKIAIFTNSFYKYQAEIGKKSSKCQATPWGLYFTIWKLFTFFIQIFIQK